MRRDKLKIMLNILEACCNDSGTNKTKIVYQVNINFKVASIYLNMLKTEDMIIIINPGPREKYAITDKGKEILGNIKELYERMEKYSLE
jgi:predicted transcriptional regulator